MPPLTSAFKELANRPGHLTAPELSHLLGFQPLVKRKDHCEPRLEIVSISVPEPLGRLEDLSRRAEPRKKEHSMQPHDEEENSNGVSGKFENCGMERNSTM